MNSLKDQIAKLKMQKQQVASGGTSWVKKGDLEKEREQKYLEEQHKREEEKRIKQEEKLKELKEFYSQSERILLANNQKKLDQKISNEISNAEVSNQSDNQPLTVQKQNSHQILEGEQIPIATKEIIRRLREFKQPSTLFGESDTERYNRLMALVDKFGDDLRKSDQEETSRSFLPQDDDVEMLKFMKQQAELLAKEKNQNEEELKEEDEPGAKLVQSANGVVDNYVGKYKTEDEMRIGDRSIDELVEIKEKNNQMFRNFRKFENQCKKHPIEEKSRLISLWCKKMLKSWENELMFKPEEFLKSADGKQEIGTLKQCVKQSKPLFKILKKNQMNAEILDGLYLIVQYSLMKEYVRAHDKYLELAIGNAPWPMGVTMVGIHERSGRSRIFSSQVAHILNDETQRKYLQSMKRLLTVCQRAFPTDPSKCVTN